MSREELKELSFHLPTSFVSRSGIIARNRRSLCCRSSRRGGIPPSYSSQGWPTAVYRGSSPFHGELIVLDGLEENVLLRSAS
jgi:hypothetical protein